MKSTNPSTSHPLAKSDLIIAFFVWLAAFALYIRTLAPSLLWGDSAEFQVLSHTLGMTHPSGYVTYIFIGKIFTLIPLGDIAWRVNLASAFFGALAAAQVYLIVRMFARWRAAALAASILLALTEGFWRRAIIAETYTAAASMIASVWLLTLLWERSGKWRYLFLAGLIGGLSVGIHSVVIMTAASVLAYMSFAARKRSDWLAASAGALLGAALAFAAFLYVDAHDPPSSIYNTVYRPSLSAFELMLSDFDTPLERLSVILPEERFWTFYFSASPSTIRARLAEYVSFFPAWAVVSIVAGIFALFARPRKHDGLYPLLSFSIVWGFGITVNFSNYEDYYIPAAVFAFGWMGAGAGAALDGFDSLLAQKWAAGGAARRALLFASSLTFILLPFLGASANLRSAFAKGYTDFIRRDHLYPVFAPRKAIGDARKLLERVEPNAVVFADWDHLYSYVYAAQLVMGRDDIRFINAPVTEEPRLADSQIAYINAAIETRPVYFTVWLDELDALYEAEKLDEGLYRIRGKR